MKIWISISFLYLASLMLVSCSQQGVYEAIQNNQCLEKTGKVYCDERQDYETYKRERDEVLTRKK